MANQEKTLVANLRIMILDAGKTNVSAVTKFVLLSNHIAESDVQSKLKDKVVLNNIKNMLGEIKNGDVVYVIDDGFYLVIDDNATGDMVAGKKYFRALKVVMNDEGKYRILGSKRSRMFEHTSAVKIRASSFDIKKINLLSQDRYRAYRLIQTVNETLDTLEEQ